MPLVRIDLLPGYTPDNARGICDGVHSALVEAVGIPVADRFQIVTRQPVDGLLFDTQYLGIHRTSGIVIIQITLSVGRTPAQKRALYTAITHNLAAQANVRPEDVFINLVEVVKENWSFGNGIAQYAQE